MNKLVKIDITNIEVCTKIYLETYSKESWNEKHDFDRVKNYINKCIKMISDELVSYKIYLKNKFTEVDTSKTLYLDFKN